jgi:two-component system, chemotaxis family, chemotaxis protein CheY
VKLVKINAKNVEFLLQRLGVLVVDDSSFMRHVVRNLLANIGVKTVFDAGDGIAALELIRQVSPDVVILDWEMPLLNGPELVRIVRSPGVFPIPDIPIIMLTAYGERWRIVESAKLGVNEFLCKPVSAKALLDRLISILLKPREIIRIGEYYGPAPRHPLAKRKADQPDVSLSRPNATPHMTDGAIYQSEYLKI